ncbi:MAG: DUF1552 domain-containing protein [Planctomycetota bacterium]|nr:DUF1552 domain-containing protein [Planctomycetota bacterium]
MNHPIDRRTLLRGLGTAIALPWMESLGPIGLGRTARAATLAAEQPVKLAYIFLPNGVHAPDWVLPRATEVGVSAMPEVLPDLLSPLDRVRRHVTIHSGLAHGNARALGDGPGDHARSAACFLTGAHPRKTAGRDIQNGVSFDQVMAAHQSGRTRFASLELGCEPTMTAGNCDSGYSCAYSANISWRSARSPVAKEINPRSVFERLFMAGPAGESAEARASRLRRRKSILDAVRGDARRLSGELAGRDREKLDEYLEGVRGMERRIERVEQGEQDPRGWGFEELPRGVPGSYREHLELMGDLMALAFRLDLTRVCTFMWANEGSNRTFPELGVRDGHHHLSHHSGDEAKIESIRRINRWQNERFADLVDRFAAIETGPDRTLLDDTLLCYGGAISDGNRHNHHDLPVIMAGRGGGVSSGRVVRHRPRTPMCDLFVSMGRAAGAPVERFGDSQGIAAL